MSPAKDPDSAEFKGSTRDGEKAGEAGSSPKKPSYRGITVRDSKYSESYDEYLECIYRLSLKNPAGWVKNIQIARRLKVKAPSVTNMLEKLSEALLIEWKPRSGIKLTETGRKRGKELVFYHNLMELFLSRVLEMQDPEKINRIACDFEHHLTPDVSRRLMDLLGVEGEFKNVDNFISEDRFPTHVATQKIFPGSEVTEMLDQLQAEISAAATQKWLSEGLIETIFAKYRQKCQVSDDPPA